MWDGLGPLVPSLLSCVSGFEFRLFFHEPLFAHTDQQLAWTVFEGFAGNEANPELRWTQELGVTLPLGFFDPLGLSKFDNPEVSQVARGLKTR